MGDLTVVTYDKDTKRKQFTTRRSSTSSRLKLLWPMTKIQKESNSQHSPFTQARPEDCCDLWQRYKKKAIHNVLFVRKDAGPTVVTYDKDTKRKQFTTIDVSATLAANCCDLWQRYKKKAIHNDFTNFSEVRSTVVTYDKDTKRKQFTTYCL